MVLKVGTINDLRKMEKIVDDYIKHLTTHTKSLLARIVRIFTVKTLDFSVNDSFILMESVRPLEKHTSFDIKGFVEGRSLADEGIANHSFGKDQDLLAS
jgi:hypothetical protein